MIGQFLHRIGSPLCKNFELGVSGDDLTPEMPVELCNGQHCFHPPDLAEGFLNLFGKQEIRKPGQNWKQCIEQARQKCSWLHGDTTLGQTSAVSALICPAGEKSLARRAGKSS
ncbi:hypothetical protein SD208_11045 [Ochrobactrum sp. BD67]